MKNGGQQLTGDLVHIGGQQEKTLRGGKGGTQRASAKGAMDGAGYTSLGLHLGDDRDGTPNIFLLGSGFGIRFGGHRRGWRNGIDCYDFSCGIRNMRTCLVSVNGDHFSRHKIILLTRWLVFADSLLPETVKMNAMKKVPGNLNKCTYPLWSSLVLQYISIKIPRKMKKKDAIGRDGAKKRGAGVDCRKTAKDDCCFLPVCNDSLPA
jgi:hypothetical protein